MMTKQEAILNKLANEPNGARDYYLTDEERTIIIECIEKQIPQKPIELKFCLDGFASYRCGSCGYYYRVECPPKYCSNCGQAIDWSDNERC